MIRMLLTIVLALSVCFSGLPAQEAAVPVQKQVEITFVGHACFVITTSEGTDIVCDPTGVEGYSLPRDLEADIVTVSHQHFDHNNVSAVGGDPIVLHGMVGESHDGFGHEFVPVDSQFGDVHIHTVECHHFPPEESPIMNAIFVFAFDGITVAHLGDIGVPLTAEQAGDVGPVDILMIPTGGKYTLELEELDAQISQLSPKVVIPMHFATDVADFVPNTQEDFLKGKQHIMKIDGYTYRLNPERLPEQLTYVALEYYGQSD